MTTPTYPRTIENGAGERLTFLRRVPGRAGERLEVRNVVSPGAGPPMHIHHFQEEALTVERGRIGIQRPGGPVQFAGAGETVIFAAGDPHRFWNAAESELVVTGYVEPPDNLEYFLTEVYDSTRRRGGKAPNPFEAAFLMHRYRGEFTLVEIPAAVRRFIFPLQVALGRLLGKYRRYADAPEPLHR